MSSSQRRRYVTQADVAREAGVSRPLVSLVMKGSPHVSDDKRQRVLQAAAELGYLGNGLATSLAGNRSHCIIGFLAQALSNPVFVDVHDGLAEELMAAGHRVVVMQGGMDPAQEDRSLRDLVALRPDGVVLAGYAGSTGALRAALHSLPVVCVTRDVPEAGVDSVVGDDDAAAREVTERLIALGHRRIAHVPLPASIPYEDRARSYAATMRDHGLEPLLIPTDQVSSASAARAVREAIDASLRAGEPLPTALFCGNDVLALGALDAVRERGLRVPEDISIVGFDDTEIAGRLGLSSVNQHSRELGRLAASILVARIGGGAAEKEAGPGAGEDDAANDAGSVHRLAPTFVPRASIGPPP
ncbi:LacI family DNA-binding transcriptional regulator [Actinomyces slackii]|uniref:Degradation activator n=3 Tax=Actinomyces slackii TaxID=52774 RepID=A0A448KCP1_9ACTO|nr:LacI family DNA-binding transcriptional regulator [Actinomyces slackii]VEG74685.1 Degradation activator [Actinomyces slackii]